MISRPVKLPAVAVGRQRATMVTWTLYLRMPNVTDGIELVAKANLLADDPGPHRAE
ncbi:hypothetical protein VFPFJ_03594 [Purpureocillium lilacinum]|uniref:Uncharacterized protein n=1 Tax=Purpureocillium lilacinum TaxID=33203 RepID=A0A179GV36_PURLI|nr:hypothetical protein VFPFJ_03594 [Purpureocillium lilacinum]OAQ81806.1 hypothetical protein VFPBJ_04390 [Purpureocillium lilacinum]OAQ91854.1 hypothetical protein VFPFJ_03594 [Purpureocillium lilacinum]